MKKPVAIILLAASVAAFALGLLWMFELRLESGDVYPPYSSLRSDPLGAMAIFESLERLPNLTVERDFRESNELPAGAHTTYLQLGGNPWEWESLPADTLRSVRDFLAEGGRLVLAFSPETQRDTLPVKPPTKDEGKTTPPAKLKKKNAAPGPDEEALVSLTDKWGFTYDFADLSGSDGQLSPVMVRNASGLPLPAKLPWHSGMFFSRLDPAWTTIYANGKDAVVIERRFGSGSLVLVSDPYFLSNEALSVEPHANLLAWLVGSGTQVFFDEAHFGIVDSTGVAALIRQYRLSGLVAGLLLLAALFAWKNFLSLVPMEPEAAAAGYVSGKDSATGFINLLHRNIPARDLLGACIAEWKKSNGATRPGAKIAEVQAVLEAENSRPARQRDPVEAYRRIAALLKKPVFTATPAAPPPLLKS